MNPAEWIALAALLGGLGAWIAKLIRNNERLHNDVNRMGQIIRTNQEESKRDYARLIAFAVEQAVQGELGIKLGKMIRRDRID